ncbi:MAG TPA: cache domain-containing protein, partial [Tepidiformaceae bacterium]
MTTGIIVLLLCLIGARLAWESYQDNRDRHHQHSEETAAQRATALNEFMLGRVSLLQGIAASPALRHLDYDTARDYLTSKQVEQLGFTGGLGLVDLDGGLRVDGLQRQPDPAPGQPATISYADREHFQQVIATGQPAIAPALMGRITPQPLLSIAVPVYGDDGQMVAVLIGGSRLDDAGGVLSRHSSSLDGRLIIVDQSGQVLADDGPVGTLQDVSSNPLLARARQSMEGHAAGATGLNGEPGRVVGYATVPISGWMVFWEQPESALLAGARRALALQLAGLAFAGIAATMGAWAVGARLDRQAAREREAAALVAVSEREARDFANRLPVLAWTRPVKGQSHDEIEFANSTMREFITGDSEGEFGPGFYETPFDSDLSRRLRDDVVTTGAGGEVEVRLRRHDSVPRSHLLRVEPVLDERGKVIRLICTATDIEELRQAQQQFQRALDSVAAGERSFRDFADSIPVLAWRQVRGERDLQIEFANARYREYETGRSDGEIGGALPYHPGDERLIRESLEESTAAGAAAELEARLRRWDGEYRWHLLRLVPIVDETTGTTEWIGGATDIQQLKETEAALQEAIRAKDDFLGLVSHELRTPLQQVLGNADILLRRGHSFSKQVQRESLHEIWVQGRRLQRLV